MTGNLSHARAALARDLPTLGYGTTRDVYLKDNVVYKVENCYDGKGVNRLEYDRMTTLTPPAGVFFPAVKLFTIDGIDVIAMEYISGLAIAQCYCVEGERHEDDCMSPEVFQLVKGILDDTGGFNTIVNDSGIYIIDMGD